MSTQRRFEVLKDLFEANKQSASLTENDSCGCADCVFNDSGVCNNISCEEMFFVPTDDIPSYVTYKHSSEPSPKEPSVTVANKRKHK